MPSSPYQVMQAPVRFPVVWYPSFCRASAGEAVFFLEPEIETLTPPEFASVFACMLPEDHRQLEECQWPGDGSVSLRYGRGKARGEITYRIGPRVASSGNETRVPSIGQDDFQISGQGRVGGSQDLLY